MMSQSARSKNVRNLKESDSCSHFKQSTGSKLFQSLLFDSRVMNDLLLENSLWRSLQKKAAAHLSCLHHQEKQLGPIFTDWVTEANIHNTTWESKTVIYWTFPAKMTAHKIGFLTWLMAWPACQVGNHSYLQQDNWFHCWQGWRGCLVLLVATIASLPLVGRQGFKKLNLH